MPGRLMCVTAHPDDECFAFGGALALAARAGFETYVICLTDGQAATHRGSAEDGAALGRIRREEFARSCGVLGVTRHELLDYQDGQLEFATLHEAAGKLVERMRSWQPQIVLTFGLDGAANAHPDHTAVSCFASAAFRWAAQAKRYPEIGPGTWQAERLYHQSTDFVLPERGPQMPAPWTVELDISSVSALKWAAFHEHATQAALLDVVRPQWDKMGRRELYTLAAAAEPQAAKMATSLWDGTHL